MNFKLKFIIRKIDITKNGKITIYRALTEEFAKIN